MNNREGSGLQSGLFAAPVFEGLLHMLLPVLAGSGALVGLGTYVAKKLTDAKRRRKKSETSAEQKGDEVPIEPPDIWAFLARWFFADANSEAHRHTPAKGGLELSFAPRSRSRGFLLSPSGVTIIIGMAAIALSFVPPVHVQLWHLPTDLIGLSRTIVFSALVGIGTNWVAIKLLFHPQKRWPMVGLQGVIPARKNVIIDGLSRGIRDNLLTPATVEKAIRDSGLVRQAMTQLIDNSRAIAANQGFRAELTAIVGRLILVFVENKDFRTSVFDRLEDMARKLPASLFGWLQADALKSIRTMIEEWASQKIHARRADIMRFVDEELANVIEDLTEELGSSLDSLPSHLESKREAVESFLSRMICENAAKIDIEKVLRSEMQTMNEGELERLLEQTSEHELAAIQYLGAVLGALAGLLLAVVSWVHS